jgi:aminopeptidase N
MTHAHDQDLWSALEEASGKPVRDIMNSWTKQVGYPVLSFEEVGQKEVHARRPLFYGDRLGRLLMALRTTLGV